MRFFFEIKIKTKKFKIYKIGIDHNIYKILEFLLNFPSFINVLYRVL